MGNSYNNSWWIKQAMDIPKSLPKIYQNAEREKQLLGFVQFT